MYYHLSKLKDLSILVASVPECAIESFEDIRTPRVCFSTSIEGCLAALQQGPEKYYVYVLKDNSSKIYQPMVSEVRDSKFTGEVWVKESVTVECIGRIECENYDWSKEYNTDRGRTTYFHYPYRWLERYENVRI